MPGVWTNHRLPSLSIHTFTAPEDGWLVNSHVIELPTQVLVVDAQYRLSYAREVAQHATSLGKPLTRLYVTHYHPDHLLGAAAFSAEMWALSGVAAKIAAAGNRVAAEEHAKIGDDMAATARQVDRIVDEGETWIDGVRLIHHRLKGAETEDALVLELPDAGAIIVQDLVYNNAHPFLGERRFSTWQADLSTYRQSGHALVLPGHGASGGPALYDQMADYLAFAEGALAASSGAADFERRLLQQFPHYGGISVLEHQMRFLFPPAAAPQAE